MKRFLTRTIQTVLISKAQCIAQGAPECGLQSLGYDDHGAYDEQAEQFVSVVKIKMSKECGLRHLED